MDDSFIIHWLVWSVGGAALVWAVAHSFGRSATPPAPAPVDPPASLDATLARLKDKAGNVAHPVAATVFAMVRNPAAFAPTAESEALARAFKARERRLKRAKARRAALARTLDTARNAFRAGARVLSFWS